MKRRQLFGFVDLLPMDIAHWHQSSLTDESANLLDSPDKMLPREDRYWPLRRTMALLLRCNYDKFLKFIALESVSSVEQRDAIVRWKFEI